MIRRTNVENVRYQFPVLVLPLLIGGLVLLGTACDQNEPTPSNPSSNASPRNNVDNPYPQSTHPEKVGVTIFLRHQQSKSLDELLQTLTSRKFYRNFPPDNVEVVRWDVVMGIGQIVTVLARPNDIRSVNTAIEKRAWGSFNTEFYPTYIPSASDAYTIPRTEGITSEDYVLYTVLIEHPTGTDRYQDQTGTKRPDLSVLPDEIKVETVRRLVGRGTLYTFRVPPNQVSALNRLLNQWVPDTRNVEAYTSYNFLPIHRKITDSPESD